MSKALNFAAFQAGWFACILGAARGMPWLGPVVVAVLLASRLMRRDRFAFALRMTGAAGLGFVADTLLLRSGVLNFGAESVSPLWMTALWLDPSPSAFAAVACTWLAAFPLLVLLTDRTVPNQGASA